MLEPNGKVKRLNGKEVHDWDTHDQSRKALMEAKEKAVRGDLQSEQNLLGLVVRWQGPFAEHTPTSNSQKVMASQVIDVYYTAQKAAARGLIAKREQLQDEDPRHLCIAKVLDGNLFASRQCCQCVFTQ